MTRSDNDAVRTWTQWYEQCASAVTGAAEDIHKLDSFVWPASVSILEGSAVFLARSGNASALAVAGENALGFEGGSFGSGEKRIWICPLTHKNADRLREVFPYTAPRPLGSDGASFGTGDRLGIATPGHVRAVRNYKAAPVFAQQSLRELNLTGRTYADAIDSATWAVFQEGFRGPWGADGDHLMTPGWVKKALAMGCTMITADLSEHIRSEYAAGSAGEVISAYNNLDWELRERYDREYLQLSAALDTGYTVRFTRESLARCVLIYGDAVAFAQELYEAGKEVARNFDFEISVDETDTPTLPEANFFTARELEKRGVAFTSLAPRFIGKFQKGIDYIGDVDSFDRDFKIHAAIARYFGYKLSIHSGSDKFSVYPSIGRHTRGNVHVKTSGTSWLEAMRVIAECDPGVYRRLHAYAERVFPVAREYYVITPDRSACLDIEEIGDDELGRVFENPHNRQVLHVSYGEMLKNRDIRTALYETLGENIEFYWKETGSHIEKHLKLLGLSEEDKHDRFV